ncbi:MAG: monooxygenase [Leptolyngbya foveolarum]|uniref:Monooxygenase n=1 Tax=Leptolyngbya foveolarum TaxID=47253 RepID=A0A2W4TZ56_9CYAN|nr:MAG: monooxygenase [Leptolyngbya foveolarum]
MKHIVVVGAGPAGVATALLLARQGMKVTLLEKEVAFERVFRGEGLMPAGLDALYQMGLKETFRKVASRRLDSWDFYVGGQRRMRVTEPENEGLATQIIDQGGLLRTMVDRAKKLPNFEFLAGWQVSELLRQEDAVIGVRANRGGEQKDVSADCIIACDGRYSRLRQLAGLSITQAKSQFDVLWFKLPAPPSLAEETPFVACLQPDRQFAFYPSWDGRLQIGWIVEKSAHKRGGLARLKEKDWIEEFSLALPPELASHFRAHKDELEGPIYLDVQVGCCEQWSIPGLLLIGDAAHPMAPNRAQGINMALRDAIVVANHFSALKDAKEEQISTDVLSAIQAERAPEIEAVQKMQLAEWQKVEFISRPGLPYFGFKAIATLFGRFKFAQNIWLHEQQGLREGVLSVDLKT